MKCDGESKCIKERYEERDKKFYCEPEVDKRWHGSPRRHRPSSSKLDSMTNGGDKDVTTRKTERARVDKPDTTISPPGLDVGGINTNGK